MLLVVNRAALEDADKRKALDIFVEGGILGARFIMDDPEKAAELLHARNPDLDLDLIKSVVPKLNEIRVWGVNGGASADVVSYSAQLSVDLGMIDRSVGIDEVLDLSIQDAVIARIGRVEGGF